MHVHVFLQAMPRQRAIHRAGVHINVAERAGHELGVGALAARARAVNGNDNRMFFQIHFNPAILILVLVLKIDL